MLIERFASLGASLYGSDGKKDIWGSMRNVGNLARISFTVAASHSIYLAIFLFSSRVVVRRVQVPTSTSNNVAMAARSANQKGPKTAQ